MADSPKGYINRRIPQSVEEAVAQHSAESIKTITKASVQKYIESFFSKAGGNNPLLSSLTKEGLKYSIEPSFDPSKDPDMRKLQVARLFDGLRQELPAILIADGGFEIIPTNFTGVDAVAGDQDFIYSRIAIMRELSISVVVGTRDISSADMLHSLLSVLFGELRFMAGGNRITGNVENGENWVVCLCPPKPGNITKTNVNNDPKDQIYMFTLELPNVLFEDHILLKTPRPEIPFLNEGVVNPPDGDLGAIKPIIIVPDEIKINQKTPVHFRLLQARFHSFRIDNPNICTIEPRDCVLNPRRLGEFELQIVRAVKNINGETTATNEVVTSKKIKVIP